MLSHLSASTSASTSWVRNRAQLLSCGVWGLLMVCECNALFSAVKSDAVLAMWD